MELPELSRTRMVRRFGDGVVAWCDGFGALLAEFAARWGVRPIELLPAGGTAVVVRCDGGVVKLTPDPVVANQEAVALSAWQRSPNVVSLLDSDVERGALLLEWLPDSSPLTDVPWTMAEVAPLLVELRRPVGMPDVPTLGERVEFLYDLYHRRVGDDRERGLVEVGRERARALVADAPGGLAHGDLHPGNVLRTGDRLVAIDPRPCLGDPTFDLIDWVFTGADSDESVHTRIDELCALVDGVDPDRLWRWCRATAVIFAIAYPDHRYHLSVAI